MHTKRRLFSAFLFVAVWSGTDLAWLGPEPLIAQGLSQSQRAQLDSVVEVELRLQGAPGTMLAIQRGGEALLRAAYGVADVETGEPMAVSMMGSVASLSKLVTAVTALTLVDEGLLNLRQPVREYLSYLPSRLGGATMEQLLSHTAGLAELTPTISPSPNGSLDPICKAMTDQAMVIDAGVAWGYSNTGFTLAGCVIEAVAEAPFRQVVQTRVFDPVGMSRSTYQPRRAMTYEHAQGHDTRITPPAIVRPYNSRPNITPAGELITTVDDLARLAAVLIGDGVVSGRRVLPAGLLASMAEPRGSGGPALNGGRRYGFGLFIRDLGGVRVLEHEGIYSGFGASIALVPDEGIAAVAISNGRYAMPMRTTQAALEIALGREPSQSEWEMEEIPAEAAAAVIGVFSGPRGDIELALVDGVFSLVGPDRSYPLVAHPHGHWVIPGHPSFAPLPANWLEAVRGPSGDVDLVRLGWRLYRRVN